MVSVKLFVEGGGEHARELRGGLGTVHRKGRCSRENAQDRHLRPTQQRLR